MTSLERVSAVLNREEPDRIPVWVQGIHSAIISTTTTEVCLDPEKLAKANIKLWEYCETDFIKFCPDAFFDSAAWGTEVKWPDNDYTPPSVTKYGVQTPEDWEKIYVQDPKKDGRLPIQLRAAEIAIRETKNKVPVCAVIYSALTWATHARSLDEVMMDMLASPDLLKKGLKTIMESAIAYAEALAEVGVHMIYYNVNRATAEVMPWEQYLEFGVPYDIEIVKVIDKLGMKVLLHSCGSEPYIYDLIEHIKPAHIINWWDRGPRSHPIREAKEKIGNRIVMCAGIDQTKTVLESFEAVEMEAKDAIEQAAPLPFILGVGCFIPTKPNYDYLKAISKASKRYSSIYKDFG